MSARCISEPVSWLRLEGYHLGEIQGAERQAIRDHVASCEACARCLARVEDDDKEALPPLALKAAATEPLPRRVRSVILLRATGVVGALSLAAALVLALRWARTEPLGRPELATSRAKGDALAFTLVRDDGERITGESGVYRDGDRFKAIVTCAPSATGSNLAFDVVVYDASGASFPLAPSPALVCGNAVPLPGAFRFMGDSEETVCLSWSEGAAVDRAKLSSKEGSEGSRLCKKLRPAPER